jgi:hypothetical protein
VDVTVRLASGAMIISVEKDLSADNSGLIKATLVLVNLGIVPLLAAYNGFLGLVYGASFPLICLGRELKFSHKIS